VTKESVAKAIVKRAESTRVDCIAIARQSRQGLRRWLQPSVTHRVIELAQVPVLVLPPDAQRSLHYEPFLPPTP
jgi:nucleotide-binding universal stress UspA family protein